MSTATRVQKPLMPRSQRQKLRPKWAAYPRAAVRALQKRREACSSEPIGIRCVELRLSHDIENLNCVAYATRRHAEPTPVRSNSCCLHACEDAFLAHRSTVATAVQYRYAQWQNCTAVGWPCKIIRAPTR